MRLVWDQVRVEMHDDEGRVDHPTVQAAQHLFHTLARRIGAVQVGAPLPRALQHQRWSPLNVPLSCAQHVPWSVGWSEHQIASKT